MDTPAITVPLNLQANATGTIKPGWKTTEFWLTVVSHLITLALASGVFKPGSPWITVASFLNSALAQFSYSGGRSDIKAEAVSLLSQVLSGLAKSAAPVAMVMLLLCGGAMVPGCSLLKSPSSAYVAADHSTYDAVAPEYGNYVLTDPKLDADQKARRQRTVQTWKLRIDQAEHASGATTKPAQ